MPKKKRGEEEEAKSRGDHTSNSRDPFIFVSLSLSLSRIFTIFLYPILTLFTLPIAMAAISLPSRNSAANYKATGNEKKDVFDDTLSHVRQFSSDYLSQLADALRGSSKGGAGKTSLASIADHLAKVSARFPKLAQSLKVMKPDPRVLKGASRILSITGISLAVFDVRLALVEGRYDDAAAGVLAFGASWYAGSAGAALAAAAAAAVGVSASPLVLAVVAFTAGYVAYEYVEAFSKDHHVGERLAEASTRVAQWWEALWTDKDPSELIEKAKAGDAVAESALLMHRSIRQVEALSQRGLTAEESAAFKAFQEVFGSVEMGIGKEEMGISSCNNRDGAHIVSLLLSAPLATEMKERLLNNMAFDQAELAEASDPIDVADLTQQIASLQSHLNTINMHETMLADLLLSPQNLESLRADNEIPWEPSITTANLQESANELMIAARQESYDEVHGPRERFSESPKAMLARAAENEEDKRQKERAATALLAQAEAEKEVQRIREQRERENHLQINYC